MGENLLDLTNDPEFMKAIQNLNDILNLANEELEAKGESGVGGVTVEKLEDGRIKIYVGGKENKN